jgi:hypothetical protein
MRSLAAYFPEPQIGKAASGLIYLRAPAERGIRQGSASSLTRCAVECLPH